MKPYKRKKNEEILHLSQVEMVILSALVSKEQYGLEIIETVKKITDGELLLSLGGLYTTLHRMERKNLVCGRWGESTEVRRGARRRYYSMTGVGELAIAGARQRLLKVLLPSTAGEAR